MSTTVRGVISAACLPLCLEPLPAHSTLCKLSSFSPRSRINYPSGSACLTCTSASPWAFSAAFSSDGAHLSIPVPAHLNLCRKRLFTDQVQTPHKPLRRHEHRRQTQFSTRSRLPTSTRPLNRRLAGTLLLESHPDVISPSSLAFSHILSHKSRFLLF